MLKQLFKQGLGSQRKLFDTKQRWPRTKPLHLDVLCDEVSRLSPRWLTALLGSAIGQIGWEAVPPPPPRLRGHHLWLIEPEGRWGQILLNPDESGITNITLRHLWLFCWLHHLWVEGDVHGHISCLASRSRDRFRAGNWDTQCNCIVAYEDPF